VTEAGATVEPMARVAHSRELIIGMATDPVFGPTLSFGAGGTLVEVLRDTATALPPLNDVLAGRMIEKTRIARALAPFRGMPAVDRAALVDVLIAVSEMVTALPAIAALDINPLFAGSDGVLAVDARIELVPEGETRTRLAIRPWPEHLQERRAIGGGLEVEIRPLRAEDAQAVSSFVDGLSAGTLRNRFLHAVRRLSARMLARLTLLDYSTELALVAREAGAPEGPLLGISRYARNADAISCEFAVAVADPVQGKGLGTALMQALMQAARAEGLERMEGYVLADNQPMRRLVTRLGFQVERDPTEPGVVRVSRSLA
jgi:acetyltransferase